MTRATILSLAREFEPAWLLLGMALGVVIALCVAGWR